MQPLELPPLAIGFGPFSTLLVLVFAVLALSAVWLSLDMAMAAVFSVLIASGALLAGRTTTGRRWRWIGSRNGALELTDLQGRSWRGQATAGTFVSPVYIGVGLSRPGGRMVRLGIFADQMKPDDFRRLAVFLRQPPLHSPPGLR